MEVEKTREQEVSDSLRVVDDPQCHLLTCDSRFYYYFLALTGLASQSASQLVNFQGPPPQQQRLLVNNCI